MQPSATTSQWSSGFNSMPSFNHITGHGFDNSHDITTACPSTDLTSFSGTVTSAVGSVPHTTQPNAMKQSNVKNYDVKN